MTRHAWTAGSVREDGHRGGVGRHTANLRCYRLGQSIRRSIETFEADERVVVFGTGGMSHQLQAQRAGFTNVDFDIAFLDGLVADPGAIADFPHVEYLRVARSEGIELVMWLVMRGAVGPRVREVYRATHMPTSNTTAVWSSSKKGDAAAAPGAA